MEFDIKSFKFNFVEKPIILMICFAVFNFLFWGNRLEGYLWWGVAVLINYLITSIYVFIKYDITFKEKE